MKDLSTAAVLYAAANALAFLTYGFDKQRALVGGQRVPEATLLWLAVAGGIGAWAACELFRHKTRKQPFRGWLIAAVVLHIALVAAGLYALTR